MSALRLNITRECEILMVISSHDLAGRVWILSKSFTAAASYFYCLIVHRNVGALNPIFHLNINIFQPSQNLSSLPSSMQCNNTFNLNFKAVLTQKIIL